MSIKYIRHNVDNIQDKYLYFFKIPLPMVLYAALFMIFNDLEFLYFCISASIAPLPDEYSH